MLWRGKSQGDYMNPWKIIWRLQINWWQQKQRLMVRIGTEEIISTRLDDRLSFADEAETGSRHLILEVQYTDQQHLHHLGGLLKMQNLRFHLRPTDSESAFLTRSQLIHLHRIKLGSAVQRALRFIWKLAIHWKRKLGLTFDRLELRCLKVILFIQQTLIDCYRQRLWKTDKKESLALESSHLVLQKKFFLKAMVWWMPCLIYSHATKFIFLLSY